MFMNGLWRYVQHDPFPLEFDAMAEAARKFEGQHDFTSFAASTGSEEEDRDRTMTRVSNRHGRGARALKDDLASACRPVALSSG